MKTNLYRCMNPKCETAEFEAPAPLCPGCKVDGRIKRYAGMIQRLVIIHFDPPDPIIPNRGVNVVACDPNHKVGGNIMATAEHSAVTCKKCKATDVFKATFPDYGGELPEGADAEVVIDPAKGVTLAAAAASPTPSAG